jgi:RHS repeat-associated protein
VGQGGYRYGFNDKEKDDDVNGTGVTYDYGFRIYDARIARFLSVDPLTQSYPAWSPYPFAMNRPIDGIDMDGLEYITYHILMQDGKERLIKKEYHTNLTPNIAANNAKIAYGDNVTSNDFYKEYSQSFGPKGRGANYIYYYSLDGKIVKMSEEFFGYQSTILSDLSRHGLFYGSECITKYGPGLGRIFEMLLFDNDKNTFYGSELNPYDFDENPIDQVDALAKAHDQAYAGFREGYKGFLTDTRTIKADLDFVLGLRKYLNDIKDPYYEDPYTKRKPSDEAIQAAKNAYRLFTRILIFKVFLNDNNNDNE